MRILEFGVDHVLVSLLATGLPRGLHTCSLGQGSKSSSVKVWPDVPPDVAGKLMGVLTFRACVLREWFHCCRDAVWVLCLKGPPAARVSTAVVGRAMQDHATCKVLD